MIDPVALVRELEQRLAEARRQSKYVPTRAFAKQREFLALTCDEALYGGAAGGGKSEALLADALQNVDKPGYAALILRRTFADLNLPGAVMSRSHQWLAGTDAHWDGTNKRWTFPSGATLTFGYLQTEADKYRYQSAEFQFIGFDELTQFAEPMYSYLFTRLRRNERVQVQPRMRGATNPGGVGHQWVKRRFLDQPDDRRFVKATFLDNPYIDHAEYDRMLSRADPITQRQMRGEWIQNTGGLVYAGFDRGRNLCSTLPKDERWTYLLGLDFGFTDSTAMCVLGFVADDPTVYVVSSMSQAGLTPSDVAERVQMLEKRYRFVKIVGDIGGLGKGYVEEARRRFALPIEAAEKNNKRGYIDLMNGDMARGRLRMLAGTTEDLVDQLETVPWNDERSREAEGHVCDEADALLYAWRASTAYHNRPEAPREAPTRSREMDEYWQRMERDREERLREEQWG